MTTTTELPADDRPEVPLTGDERAILEGFLEFHRATLRWKLAGVSDADARRQLLPSLTTAAGLVKHLIDVEQSWFIEVMTGGEVHSAYREEDPDGIWRVGEDETVAGLLADYEMACQRCRETVASLSLDDEGSRGDARFSLRWVYIHMIEETARHNGHLDIIRELLDGATGE